MQLSPVCFVLFSLFYPYPGFFTNEKAEQVVKDIDNAQFNNVLFKEALENVKNIYISNGLSQ